MNNTKVDVCQVVESILYRLKTGCQWRELPMRQFFRVKYRWQSVFYHFRKWCKDGSWGRIWQHILGKYKHLLDMSSVQLDGIHTLAKRGGEAVAYQGRKKGKTSNLLILADSKGTPLACGGPVAGNHNDAFGLVPAARGMVGSIQLSGISTDGLFLNADAGFDNEGFRDYCFKDGIIGNIDKNIRNGSDKEYLFDELLYKCRFVIERTNAWMDAFKAILVRFETSMVHWKALNILAFCVILLRQL
jgi:transposase